MQSQIEHGGWGMAIAIALFTWLSDTSTLRAETNLAWRAEDNRIVVADVVLEEIIADSSETKEHAEGIEHVTASQNGGASPLENHAPVLQSPREMAVDLSHPGLFGEEFQIDPARRAKPHLPIPLTIAAEMHAPTDFVSEFDDTVPLLLTREKEESGQTALDLADNANHEHEVDYENESHRAVEEPLRLADNRAARLQPLGIASDQPDKVANQENWPSPIHDNQVFWLVLVDELEYRFNDGTDALNWDVLAWVGGDYQRLWVKTEGDVGVAGDGSGEAELQVLYGRLVSSFWDVQAGLRYDRTFGPGRDVGRAFAVVGMQGLTPYLFEVDAALFISEDGDVSARFEAEYQFLLTQRLILQPELEINVAAQQVEDFGVGSGLNDIELSLRLRYEVSRQFAPYVGVSWTRKFGQTADFAREEGESTDNFAVVGGVRLLF